MIGSVEKHSESRAKLVRKLKKYEEIEVEVEV